MDDAPHPAGSTTRINAPSAPRMASVPAPAPAASPGPAPALAPVSTAPAAKPTGPLAVPPTYRELTELLKAHKPRIGAAFENVICENYAPPRLVLTAAKTNTVFADILREPDTQKMIAQLFDNALTITVEDATASNTHTLAEERAIERQTEVRDLKEAGAVHPAVKKVIETLGGQIRTVQVRAALTHPAEDYDER